MADTIAVMNEGRIEQMGSGEELYERPRTEFVANFLGLSNLLDGTVGSRDGAMATFDAEEGERVLRARATASRTSTAARSGSGSGRRRSRSPRRLRRRGLERDPQRHPRPRHRRELPRRRRSSTSSRPRPGRELTVIAPNRDGDAAGSIGPGRDVSLAWDPAHTFVVQRQETTRCRMTTSTASSSGCSTAASTRAASSSATLPAPACSLGPGSAFLAACGGVKGESSGKKASTAVNHPKVADRRLDVLQLAAVHRQVGPEVVRQEVRRARQVRRGHQRQLRVLREGPPAAAGGQADRPRHRRAHRLHGGALGARRLRHGDRQERTSRTPRTSSPELQTIDYDPKRNFTLPWQSGAIGIGYDPRKTGRKLNSIKDFFDPKFKGRVSFLSEPYDSAGMVMLMQGVDSDAREHRSDQQGDRQDRGGAEGRPDPALHRQRLHDRPHQGEPLGRDGLLGRPRRPAGRQPAPRVRLPRGGLDDLHRQHDDPGQGGRTRTRPRR